MNAQFQDAAAAVLVETVSNTVAVEVADGREKRLNHEQK